ncbi:uncharacterized protein LOC105925751 [Fundulus heteroclitus]|uniref:uncharacterized protein LOC105925751 n=1 Tax=Fundulus heteroclitus TaxID=8078 RepID=UPI00165A540F|nr:uncharacterized protein LOC105925751 [Fundulus heteroclitus]
MAALRSRAMEAIVGEQDGLFHFVTIKGCSRASSQPQVKRSSISQEMFAAKTKAVLRCLGAERDLIYNDNLNNHIEMFSLVKINKRKGWPITKYSFINLTLKDLMFKDAPENLSEFISKGSLLKDIRTSDHLSLEGKLNASFPSAKIDGAAEGSNESSASQFDLKYETVNLREFRKRYENRKIQPYQPLKSTERLTFVYKIVRNSKQVELFSKISGSGSVSAKQKQTGAMSARGKGGEEIRFSVPEDSTFAFGLAEIDITDEKLKLPLVCKEIKRHARIPSHFGKPQKKKNKSRKTKGETEDEQQNQ